MKIEAIKALEVGINFNESDDAYDIVLYSEFESKKDLDAYQNHPAHSEAREFIQAVRWKRKVVDYEIA